MQDLAAATGAGVAAADHAIGSAAEGGNWQLDIRLAGARGEIPFSAAALGAFHELLGTWGPAPSMATARLGQTATLLGNGKVLEVRGEEDTGFKALWRKARETWTQRTRTRVAAMAVSLYMNSAGNKGADCLGTSSLIDRGLCPSH